MKSEHRIIILSLVATLSFWAIDGLFRVWMNYDKTFLKALEVDARGVALRLFFSSCFLLFVLFLAKAFSREREAKEALKNEIEEHRKAEDALWQSEHFLQAIIEAVPECIKLVASDGALLKINRAGLEMIEADSFDQVKDASFRSLISPPHRRAFEKLTEDVFHGKEGVLEFELVGMKGRRLWLRTHAVPLRNEENQMTALLGITHNITEQKRNEQERENLIFEVSQAIEKIGTLSGLLPMCAWCKRIRDDEGYWENVETYIQQHSDASFTHGICPECLEKMTPEGPAALAADGARDERYKKKREFKRMPFEGAFSSIESLDVREGKRSAVSGTVDDISEAGVCIRTDSAPDQKSLLIFNNGGEYKIGVIRWVKYVAPEYNGYKVGVKFVQA